MKKWAILAAGAALLLASVPVFAALGWGRIQTEWELTFNYHGSEYNHHMTIDYLDPSTGDFSGTGYYKGGPITWAVIGNISGSDITFTIDYDSSSYYVDVVGSISDDGSYMSGTWDNPWQVGETWEGTATYKNHGEYVKQSADKPSAAQPKTGRPAVSK